MNCGIDVFVELLAKAKGNAGSDIVCGYAGEACSTEGKIEDELEVISEDKSKRLERAFKEFTISSGSSAFSKISRRTGIAFPKNCFHFFIRLDSESGAGNILGPHVRCLALHFEHACKGSWN